MLRAIHSIPNVCPDCSSFDLNGIQLVIAGKSNTIVCGTCGITMVLYDRIGTRHEDVGEEPAVVASILSCRHCGTVDEVHVAGGEEWCGGCGLDPNIENYPVADLAHLWKQDSGIRGTMEQGTPKATMGNLYRVLTNSCGPHCSYAEACPQETANFVQCYREESAKSENPFVREENEVGRRGRGVSRKARKEEKKRIRQEKERAILACASTGWYEKKYRNETENPQESEHTGSGSGT